MQALHFLNCYELLFLELLFFEFFFLKTSCGSPNYAETLQFFFSFFPITMQALEIFFEKKLLAAHPTMQALQFVFYLCKFFLRLKYSRQGLGSPRSLGSWKKKVSIRYIKPLERCLLRMRACPRSSSLSLSIGVKKYIFGETFDNFLCVNFRGKLTILTHKTVSNRQHKTN